MSYVISGCWFVWERGLDAYTPVVYVDGYPASREKKIAWKTRITEEESNLPLSKLATKYPLENIPVSGACPDFTEE